MPEGLFEDTLPGLHDYVVRTALAPRARPGLRAVDLGAGTGALAERLRGLGFEVCAVDRTSERFGAAVRFLELDLDAADFALRLGPAAFDVVTAVEVIEHLENPTAFLRNVARLLAPRGVALLTTPNVESTPARLKFLLRGRLRLMEEPTHITPVFMELLRRHYLPRSGLRLVEQHVYPPGGHLATRPAFAWPLLALGRILGGEAREGDIHVLVLEADSSPA